MLNVVLYEPEIPPNTGNLIRLCANSGAALHLIEPLGFSMDEKSLRRAGLDYHESARVRTWSSLGTCLEALGLEAVGGQPVAEDDGGMDAADAAATATPFSASASASASDPAPDPASAERPDLGYMASASTPSRRLESSTAARLPPRLWATTSGGDVPHTAPRYRAGDLLLFGPESRGLPPEVLSDPRVAARLRIPMRPGSRSLNLSNAVSIVLYEAWRQLDFTGATPTP